MTRDDIIRMALEAGWTEYSVLHPVEVYRLERFANLVAAAEREACANVCEETTAAWTQPDYNGACVDCAAAIRARRSIVGTSLPAPDALREAALLALQEIDSPMLVESGAELERWHRVTAALREALGDEK